MTLRAAGLSIVHPVYDDFSRLPYHYAVWRKYKPESMARLNIVLVDDHSKHPLMGTLDVTVAENLHVYRISDNLKWNTPGALNLGITQAPDEWVLCMDSDCMLFPDMLEKLLDQSPDPEKFYYFKRKRICNTSAEKAALDRYLPCAILTTKTAFLKIGGFDEDYTGAYSGGYGFFDTDLENRIKAQRLRMQYNDIRITEYMEDIVGPNVHTREDVRNSDKINKKIYYNKIEKRTKEGPQSTFGPLCRFRWKKVY